MGSRANDLPPDLHYYAAGGAGRHGHIDGHGNGYYLRSNANDASFTQLHSDGIFAPPIIASYGNNSPLSLNINGFDFGQAGFHPNAVLTPPNVNANGAGLTQSQFLTDGVFTPPISTFAATYNGHGLSDGVEFADVNGYLNNISPASNAHGFNHGNNPLPIIDAYNSNYDNNSALNMGEYSYNYVNDPLPPGNNAHGSVFTTTPQVTHGLINPTDPGLLTAAPFVSPDGPNAAEFSATAPGAGGAGVTDGAGRARPACPVCQKTYGRLSDLKRHAAKHRTGHREFSCPATWCRYRGDKGFTRKDKMKEHVKNMHPEIDIRSL